MHLPIRIIIFPNGRKEAVNKYSNPICIKMKIIGEKITVVIIETEEIVSNEMLLIIKVALIANADDKKGAKKLSIRFSLVCVKFSDS